ncbi:MAG: FHA domain-containing protein [Planctomycetes bacterium]|nr:FHA domain-containing protein [Planctomycetota bacterium]
MPTLYVLQGPDKGRTYTTPNEPAIIGRSSDHIHLSDHGASRRHAEIAPENGSWVLNDLNSSNGTYLNGQRVLGPTVLKHGDQIKVGNTLMVFSGLDRPHGASGAKLIRDLVDLDLAPPSGGASILSAMNASEESVILQPPETADAVAAWNVVYRIAEAIGTVSPLDAFLERVADIVFEHLIVDHLVVLMVGPDGGEMIPQLVRFRVKEQRRKPKIVTSRTIVSHVVQKRDGILCANALTDDRFRGESNEDSLHRLGLRSIICVPIIAHNELHGVIHLDCSMSRHTYTQEQLRLVVAIGRLTGMAIENARLLESRVRNERLAAAGEAVAYLSHYIRNILQGMQGGAEVIELGLKRRDMQTSQSGWALMRRNLDRIFELTLNMLTFSKNRKPRIETAQLNKVVRDVVGLAQSRADEKSVMILTELDEIPAVPLDSEGIHQVIQNLVLNAIYAVPAGTGRVNLATRYEVESGDVVLTVSDNGPGVPLEERDRIFEAFHSTKGHGGTGLGLAAAKKIVTELGGRIELQGTAGEGAIFVVRLPTAHVTLADSGKTHGPVRV